MRVESRLKIRDVAKRVRKVALSECDDDPTAQCYVASSLLFNRLREAGFKPRRVRGTFEIDKPDPEATPGWAYKSGEAWFPIHHWIEVDKVIVDVTADQFNDELEDDKMPDIVVGTYVDFPRYTALKRSSR